MSRSAMLGWTFGTTDVPSQAQRLLSERIIMQGAPDLVNVLEQVDVMAAREIVDMARWPRIGNWRTGTDDVPDEISLRIAREVIARFGEDDDTMGALMRTGHDLDACRRMLELAGDR